MDLSLTLDEYKCIKAKYFLHEEGIICTDCAQNTNLIDLLCNIRSIHNLVHEINIITTLKCDACDCIISDCSNAQHCDWCSEQLSVIVDRALLEGWSIIY